MARVNHVKKARKARPEHGIEVGDSYYYWEFRFGGTYYSKTYPRPSQLTQSEFKSTYLRIGEELSDALKDAKHAEDIESAVENAVGEIESLRDETQDKLYNMPEQLQDSDTGQLIQERCDNLDSWAADLQNIDYSELSDLEERLAQAKGEDLPEEAQGEPQDEVSEVEQSEINGIESEVESAREELISNIEEADPGID